MKESSNPLFAEVVNTFGFRRSFENQQIVPTDAIVAEMEKEIGFTLPVDYREFLLTYGSIWPSVSLVAPLVSKDECVSMRCFFGFFRPDPNPNLMQFDLRHSYKAMRNLERIQAHFLPFMDGDGGNALCLQLTGDRKGSIWAWMFEMFDDMDEHDFLFVAPDFQSLLRSFRAVP